MEPKTISEASEEVRRVVWRLSVQSGLLRLLVVTLRRLSVLALKLQRPR